MSMHRTYPPLPTNETLEQIEQTAYRLLEEVGISVQQSLAVERLAGFGCRVIKGRVQIPADSVQSARRHIVPLREFRSLDGERAVAIGAGRPLFHNTGGIPFIIDTATGQRRPALTSDLAAATRLLDALPNVDVITNLFGPRDAPAELLPIIAFETIARHTRKPVFAGAEKAEDVRFITEMAKVCCGGDEAFRRRPTLAFGISPVSPLIIPNGIAAAIMEAAERGAALMPLSAPSLGATGPITLPAALALQHAETLASIVLIAATRPGTPVLYCSRVSSMDLRTAVSSWGGPEIGLTGAWATQLGHRLGLPCNTYGLSTSSARLDAQAAYEKLSNAWAPLAASADVLSGVGSLDSLLAGGFEVAVMDDEIIGLLRHIGRDIVCDEETLAYDLMREVIETGGVFLDQPQTVRQMRRGALWIPGISDWGGAAGVGMAAHARQRAKTLLDSHDSIPWPADISQALTDLATQARRELIKA